MKIMLPIPNKKIDANENETPDAIIRVNDSANTNSELMIPRIGNIIDICVAWYNRLA